MVSKSEVLRAAREVFPDAKNLQEITKSYSHKIFKVNTSTKKFVIKLENNKKPHFSLRKEKRIHNLMREKGIPVPKVIYLDDSGKKFDFEFMILSYEEGNDLDKIWNKLSKKEKEKLSEEMGKILGKIHLTKFEEFGFLTPEGIKVENIFRFKSSKKKVNINPSSSTILLWAFNSMAILATIDSMNKDFLKKIFSFLVDKQELSESYEKPSLIHGDFNKLNIKIKKVSGNWEICSLFDFEYAASMPREYDFIKLYREGFFEKENLKNALLKGYLKYPKEVETEKMIKLFNYIIKHIGISNKELYSYMCKILDSAENKPIKLKAK